MTFKRSQRTKTIEAEITEIRTRCVNVEVPIDASDSDSNFLYELTRIPSEEEADDFQVTIEDSNICPEYRMDMRDGMWHLTSLHYDTPERRRLAFLHERIVNSVRDSGDLYFNRVTVELPDERVAPGCIYYRAGYAVVVAVTEEAYRTGILRGFDRCFPTMTEAGPIPWDAVDELDEYERMGTWDLLDRAAEWLAELDPKEREQRQFVVPGSTITHPTPRKAVDADELDLRFQPGSDASDVTG